MATPTRRFVLARRPEGALDPSVFRLEQTTLPDPADGEVLVRALWLSIDPYMRGRVSAARSYAAPIEVGEPMIGGAVGEVIASRHANFPVGARVVGYLGWQEHALMPAKFLQKIDDARVPLTAWLGAAGMPGVTAWVGLHDVAQARPGETVCVSAATGAVGSVVGQLARLHGCHAVGIAGGGEKCRYAVDELGFAACVDHRAPELSARLAAAAPSGIDVSFENVGGPVLDAVLEKMNVRGRVAVCGLIADYDAPQRYGVRNLRAVLTQRLRVEGFIVSDHLARFPEVQKQLADLIAERKIVWRESIAEGLERAPQALMDVLAGRNFGKQLVKL
jgi:NADPH-dependent curcumin reductase CurA